MFCATILKQRREKSAPIKQDSVFAKGVSINSLLKFDEEDKKWVFDSSTYNKNTYLNIDNLNDCEKFFDNSALNKVDFLNKVVQL